MLLFCLNPFSTQLPFDLHSDSDETASVALINAGGIIIQQRVFRLQGGTNHLQLENVAPLPSGVYFLVCRVGSGVLKKTLFKQNNNTH